MTYFNDSIKHTVDLISLTTVIGTLTAILPPLAALLSIIWTAMRIYEMITGKQIADRRKKARL